jgi:hypothetical protein
VIAFRDIRPAAAAHFLVCPREHIVSARHLQADRLGDAELGARPGSCAGQRTHGADAPGTAAHMYAVGRTLVEREAPGARTQFGYHLPPFNSVDHLHLHCFALPFMPAWKSLKYTPAVGHLWYLPAESLLQVRCEAARGARSLLRSCSRGSGCTVRRSDWARCARSARRTGRWTTACGDAGARRRRRWHCGWPTQAS